MPKKKSIEEKIKNYTADKQTALTEVEKLYKRPALTFGGEAYNPGVYDYSSQKTVCLREIIDNAVGEIEVGVSKLTYICFHKDGSITIQDQGRGMPVDVSTDAYGKKVSGLYKSMGIIGAGQSLGGAQRGKFVTSLNGVGGSSTQFMSSYFKIEVYRDKKIYRLDFKNGKSGLFEHDGTFTPHKDKTFIYEGKDTRDAEQKKLFPHGTKITLKLNDKRFKAKAPYDKDDLILRLKMSALFYPGTDFVIEDEVSETKEVYRSENGLCELLQRKVSNPLTDVIYFRGQTAFRDPDPTAHEVTEKNKLIKKTATGKDLYQQMKEVYEEGDLLGDERELLYDLYLIYDGGYDTSVTAFCNSILNTRGGVHVKAVEKVLECCLNTKFRSMKSGLSKKDKDVTLSDIEEGLHFIISVKTNEPEFDNQAKMSLTTRPLGTALQKALEEDISVWLNDPKNRNVVEVIAKKVITAMKNRTRIQDAQALNREKSKITSSSIMPDKLVDCEETHTPESEVYICEGDSAMSGLKGARSSKNQALLPIRGKILNVLKASPAKILANQEIQDIIKCLDAGTGDEFKVENARYQKIIIASDADVDGDAIANLLITLVYKLFPDLLYKGCLYRMMSPLYELIVSKDEHYYCMTIDEKKEVEKKLREKGKKVKEIKRFKGLGETGDSVLKETGMDPKTRSIMKITVSDAEAAREKIELISGEDTDKRKEWIMENPYQPEIVEVQGE